MPFISVYPNPTTNTLDIKFVPIDKDSVDAHLATCPPGTVIMDFSNMPAHDRDMEAAWELSADKKSIVVNIEKARTIYKTRIMAERDILLARLDAAEPKAQNNPDHLLEIQEEKNRLLSLTDRIDKAATTFEMRMVRCDAFLTQMVIDGGHRIHTIASKPSEPPFILPGLGSL